MFSKPRTGFVYDLRLSRHYNRWNPEFVEIPERVTDPFSACERYKLVDRCLPIQCREATEDEMTLKHSKELVEKLRLTEHMTEEELKNMSKKYDFIYFHPLLFESCKLALGGTIDLVKAVLREEVLNGLAIIRPPGHHAQFDTYCGYSYLNNVATAAQIALDQFGMERILIVDWDVHHGQGTQYMFYDDPRVLVYSIHTYDYGREWPYLRESDYDYIGEGQGRGYNINVPLNKPGCGNDEYMAIFHQLLLPVAYEFCPELVLVSAGYDSAIGCPEGQMEVTPAMYAHFINHLSALCEGKMCLILEGGYCVKSLAESIALSLRALLGDPTPMLVQPFKEEGPDESVKISILNAIKMLRPFWKCLRFQDDLKEDNLSKENVFLELPPKPGIKFYTNAMPESFDLFQPCYDVEYEQQKQGLYHRIDSLIANTNLEIAPHRCGIVTDLNMLLHKDPSGECEEVSERVSVCCEKLRSVGLWGRCQEIPSRQATFNELGLVHKPEYIKLILNISGLSEESVQKYQETFNSVYLCNDSYLAAITSAGCLLNACDNVLSGKSQASVAVIRPPGHHAKPNAAYGFCIFNNVGIAAKYIREKCPEKKVLIVDWDLHHGNGTQTLFYENPNVLYISIHRHDCGKYFPCGCVGSRTHCGKGEGEGYNVNLTWNHGTRGDGDYIAAFTQVVMPIAYQFGPDVVLISAGFDACLGDQLGHYEVSPACYGHMTQMLKTLANGNVILALEGGYNWDNIANSMSVCVSVLLGDTVPPLASVIPCKQGIMDIKKTLDVQKKYWSALKFRVALPTPDQLIAVSEGLLAETDEESPEPQEVLDTTPSGNEPQKVLNTTTPEDKQEEMVVSVPPECCCQANCIVNNGPDIDQQVFEKFGIDLSDICNRNIEIPAASKDWTLATEKSAPDKYN